MKYSGRMLNRAFALLLGASAACNPQNITKGDLEFADLVNDKKVYYNEGVAVPMGIPLANRMIFKDGSFTFTLYDVTDRIPVADPRDGRLERICVQDGSSSEQCYRRDDAGFEYEGFFRPRRLSGTEEDYPRDLFNAGDMEYNKNRPEIAKQLAARRAVAVKALHP